MFRKTLDGEMKDATKCGVAQASKMSEKEEITERAIEICVVILKFSYNVLSLFI